MKRTLMLLTLLLSPAAHATGTIPLSINGTADCATSRSGDNFTGVTTGACSGSTTPPPPPIANRLTVSNVLYPNSALQRRNVDVTSWLNIWGHFNATDSLVGISWPGRNGAAPALLGFTRNDCVAAAFTPSTPTIVGTGAHAVYEPNGFFTLPYVGEPGVTVSISDTPCDFDTHLGQTGCIGATQVPGQQLISWYFGPVGTNPPQSARCDIHGRGSLYLNAKFTNPAQLSGACPTLTNQVCPIELLQQTN